MCSPKLFQVSYDWVNEFYDVERKSEKITITKLRVCERERKREMNVCVQIFLTQAACHLLNSFHEREKDKHKTKLSGSCRGEFVRLESFLTSCAYTLVLTRFLLVKCRGTAHIESKKQKKKQSHFFTSSSFLEFI